MGSFEHTIFVQLHQLHQFGPSSSRDSNGRLNTPSIHTQLGTGDSIDTAGTPNGGSTSSSLADVLKPHSRDEVVNLALLDLHNHGSFSGHHNMGAPPQGNSGTGPSTCGYTMEQQGQVQALDLAIDFPTNWYSSPTNPTISQSQGQSVDPR